ncbi:hypothetical protein O181_025274 [Austropuccinia psidii MF-1]|uniref:Uncharacterized protein n=1 Tax=Austropuccinia psidii MF-1 TaxID=1389203 RepID=A0A9Q3H0G9_9BASI|nr:hypothetical protein [Austropuccinia psidii MF-1]
MEGEAPSRKEGRGPRKSSSFSGVVGTFTSIQRTTLKGPGDNDAKKEENSVEEEESKVLRLLVLLWGNIKPEPSLLALMQQMTQIRENLQAASSSGASRPPALKTLSMKEPDFFERT